MTALQDFTPDVHLVDGIPKTTSLNVAQVFGKQHKDVLRAIRSLDCSEEFSRRNFAPASYLVDQPNGGQAERPMYELTRDGFVFLVMGFTGKEAARWKEAYIAAFNAMEQCVHDFAPVNGPITLAELARREAVLKQALEALAQVPVVLSGEERRLLGATHVRLETARVRDKAHRAVDVIIQMEADGRPRDEICAVTGKTHNHVRQVVFQARREGLLPPLRDEAQGGAA